MMLPRIKAVAGLETPQNSTHWRKLFRRLSDPRHLCIASMENEITPHPGFRMHLQLLHTWAQDLPRASWSCAVQWMVASERQKKGGTSRDQPEVKHAKQCLKFYFWVGTGIGRKPQQLWDRMAASYLISVGNDLEQSWFGIHAKKMIKKFNICKTFKMANKGLQNH